VRPLDSLSEELLTTIKPIKESIGMEHIAVGLLLEAERIHAVNCAVITTVETSKAPTTVTPQPVTSPPVTPVQETAVTRDVQDTATPPPPEEVINQPSRQGLWTKIKKKTKEIANDGMKDMFAEE
jgi:hypothetical protein